MVWVDNAKILSSFAVIVVHISSVVVLGVDDRHTSIWWAGNIYDSLSRWCVPVFIMISGFLLLDPSKKEPLKVYYQKRFSKIFIPIFFWTLFYLFWVWLAGVIKQDSITLAVLTQKVFTGQVYYHMWYLYMLLGLYLVAPFFRKLVGVVSFKELSLLCLIMFFMSVTQNIANHLSDCENTLFYNWFLLYLPYFIIGYVICYVDLSKYNWLIAAVFWVSVITTSLGSYFLSSNYDFETYFYSYLSINVITMSICMLFLFKRLIKNLVNPHFSTFFLGIYLIHPVCIDVLKLFGITPLSFHPLFSIPIISFIVFLMSIISVKMILKVPHLSKVI